ncbi:DNA-directed RNA polymerase sigma-70 factor [Actinocatenispora thailandica]|uniref:DNA-directed RNA polymerase sigma-70 factor n=1 Tax=Actinocatenispora thailandica TaxID=227318 RepID=A0A7R7HUD3_9ACTN|nr:SigE family RNA polymerase sigma factor [Actinocatenispora thailandica]BCJ32752.1 DNA-directed RNA polymerase sigma-70 factor [Actinocatenispora thailandica]
MSEDSERADDAGYTAFVERCWGPNLRVATLLVGNRHRAEELLQDCLVKLYPKWRRVSRSGNPDAYLRRMLANGRVSWWRRRRREQLVADPPDHAGPDADGEPYDELRQALLSLPPRQRAVVVLRHYADLSERDVAAALGCTVGTVKSQNSRALDKLRGLLTSRTDQGAKA